MPDGVRVCLIGELRAEVGAKTYRGADLGSRKGRMLLAALAADPARTVSAAALAEALWPGEPPGSADATIASLVSRLRKTLGAEIISGGRSGYRLGARPRIDVDLAAAARLVAEAEHRLDAGQPGLAAAAAQAALATLDAGRALDDLDDAEWVATPRAEQANLLRRARHTTVTASLTTGDHRTAQRVAEAATLADPLDETAVRGLLGALAAAGDVGAALAVYERLRAELADQLGADPSAATQRLHESILRGDAQAGRLAAPRPNVRPALLGLAGRDAELADLQRLWAEAAAGTGALVLLAGDPGAGKTRLAEELAGVVSATGGAVLVARCYEAEKGLFLQPLVEAISTATATWPATVVRAAATEHLDALSRLVPELRAITAVVPARAGPADIERRRSMEAVSAFLSGLAAAQPLLLVLDDLHNAGRSTVELLHYLRIRLRSSPMLVVATLRSAEGAGVVAALDAVATTIEVGGLPEAAIRTLAGAAGQAPLAGEIARRTRGNALFVVEILRGLAEGTALPASLRAAVLARVGGLGPVADRVLRGGAVLGASFDPRLAAQLSGTPVADALRCCEQALLAGLLVPAGRAYEFANDVLREVVYATTPEPTRLAHHARAVDMLAAFPEQVAEHASVIEDWPRAARAWLLAAERALERFATGDAAALAKSARDAAARSGDAELSARALLIGGRASYANRDYATSWADLGAAVEMARAAGDRRLEMVALREQSHDPHVALGRPPADSEQPMLECLRIAESLGDRTFEADILGRLAILATNRLDFVSGLRLAERALRVGRSVGRGRALVFGLDAAKTANAYLGEAGAVAEIVTELEPLERADGDLTLLQWTVFESFVVPMAAGDITAAIARIEAALAINRRIGMAAFEPFFAAYLGWVYRLGGDLRAAAEVGARAVEQSREHRHAWWVATAGAMHATTLVALDRPTDAARIVESALPLVEAPGAESYRLRCLAALAAATDSIEMRDQADALLQAIRAPDGCAWLLGADAYLSIAARWAADGDPGRAERVLAPLHAAAARVPWPALRDLVPIAVR